MKSIWSHFEYLAVSNKEIFPWTIGNRLHLQLNFVLSSVSQHLNLDYIQAEKKVANRDSGTFQRKK